MKRDYKTADEIVLSRSDWHCVTVNSVRIAIQPTSLTRAARVAVPIIITVAVRTPGHDDGMKQRCSKLLESLPLSHPKGDSSFFKLDQSHSSRDSIF